MALFGNFMRDMEDDPFFSAHTRSFRQMNSMMNEMMAPFDSMGMGMGMFGLPSMGFPMLTHPGMNGNNQLAQRQQRGFEPFNFGFPNVMMGNFQNMSNDPNCHSFSSSSVMTYTAGEDGQPRLYKASASTRTAPGGVKETRKSEMDSGSGLQRMAIGHHIGERGHVLERTQNKRTGEHEENQEYINLEEEEADSFNREWCEQTQGAFGGSRHNQQAQHQHPSLMGHHNRQARHNNQMLAIADSSSAVTSPSQGGARITSLAETANAEHQPGPQQKKRKINTEEAPGPSRSRKRDEDSSRPPRKHDKHRTKGTPRQ